MLLNLNNFANILLSDAPQPLNGWETLVHEPVRYAGFLAWDAVLIFGTVMGAHRLRGHGPYDPELWFCWVVVIAADQLNF